MILFVVLQEDKTNEKALWKKIKVLCFQGRFQEANVLTTEWIEAEPTVCAKTVVWW